MNKNGEEGHIVDLVPALLCQDNEKQMDSYQLLKFLTHLGPQYSPDYFGHTDTGSHPHPQILLDLW